MDVDVLDEEPRSSRDVRPGLFAESEPLSGEFASSPFGLGESTRFERGLGTPMPGLRREGGPAACT